MRFLDIYTQSKAAFRSTMTAMWCSNSHNKSQKAYAAQIKKKMDEMFAPDYAMPLVQCMNSYRPLMSVTLEKANSLIGNLWTKKYQPYEHQYQCWKSLSEYTQEGHVKSIVVTTGTGSGKTECFMLPLISDLKKTLSDQSSTSTCGVQAIFLYPLNALMEDQKHRLQEFLSGTDLTFAVYNGNLPEDRDFSDHSLCERIDEEKKKYPNILETRKEMRVRCPNILLTNPTMLEYMLLRNKDQCLFKNKGSLRWVVIDETHTYSGASAAELAMLMRRVMHAFEVAPSSVRFATSSATIGNRNEVESQENNDTNKLKRFIADISGQSISQIDIITGERVDYDDVVKDKEVEKYRKKLFSEEYISLDKLIPGETLSIEDRLKELDRLCDKGLKAKVHYFNRVLNQGLKVQLTRHKDGCFDVFTTTPIIEAESEPYLELMRCSSCGEYIAVGEIYDGDSFGSATLIDNDIFDFSEQNDSKKVIFGLSEDKTSVAKGKGNTFVEVEGDKMLEVPYKKDQWNIVRNIQGQCPHCNSGFKKEVAEGKEDLNSRNIYPFRIASDFVARIISPVLLKNLEKATKQKDKLPHYGQQYLSFVDSRQSAARSTLNQNLEQERIWVYSRIFHELSARKLVQQKHQVKIEERNELRKKEKEYANRGDDAKAYKMVRKIKEIEKELKGISDQPSMSWKEIFELLINMPECDRFCMQFAKRNRGSDEVDEQGEIKEKVKAKYVYSVMIELLGRRPSIASSPETMGLFTSYYPLLESEITKIPPTIESFNKLVSKQENRISLSDWRSLLQIFLDHNARSNMSVFLKDPDFPKFDIKKDFQRFETQKKPRKPIQVPIVGPQAGIIVKLIASLLDQDYKKVLDKHKEMLQEVVNCLVDNLKEIGLLEKEGPNYADENVRLNLMNLSFKLYDSVSCCDVSRFKSVPSTLRPVENLFKGYSPYLKDHKVVKPLRAQEKWEVFPYIKGVKDDGFRVSITEVEEWASKHRKLLYDNGLWGEDGCFSNRLTNIYSYPDIFIQAEHTAQVDKLIAKQSQDMFKEKQLNILACSTTMEMGIDLGDLELVLLCSIPPHPANYKQRAGRSGRDLEATRSACVTLCGSDSIGLRTLRNPLESLINRVTAVPFVDLNSRQVVQRHVNSFLLRNSNILFNKEGSNLDQKVISFFTAFSFDMDVRTGTINYQNIRDDNNSSISIRNGLGDKSQTRYMRFKEWILNAEFDKQKLVELLSGTCFEGKANDVLRFAGEELDRCYNELQERVCDVKKGFDDIYQSVKGESSDGETMSKIKSGNLSEYRYARYLMHKYSEILGEGLLTYFATHRFTPNANMPVNIIEFDINFNNTAGGYWNYNRASNPSYVLQEAISQYAPGNTIILSNRARIVRGVLYTGAFQQVNTFKKVYTDGCRVSIDKKLDRVKKWSNVSNRDYLELIQPYAFIPDVNEYDSRAIEKNIYTNVNAQLINTTEWQAADNNLHLISCRTSDDSGESSILYYNVGIGYGYCMCSKCGKTVLEVAAQGGEGKPKTAPPELNNSKDNKSSFHYNIKKIDQRCSSSIYQEQNPALIRRNVILGDRIQTDYCELRIRRDVLGTWSNSEKDKGLVLTLAIVFTRTLVEYLGIESRDVAFIRMPNSHICIYDTNPGGSGYAKRLGNAAVLNEVIDRSYALLKGIKDIEELLDRYSLRYKEELDIEKAIKWLSDEIECRMYIPEIVQEYYPEAVQTSYSSLIDACKQRRTKDSPLLFVSNQWDKWCYKNESGDWNYRVSPLKSERCILYIWDESLDEIPIPIINMLQQMKDWLEEICTIDNPTPKGLYPIAYVDGWLYFTIDKGVTNLNQQWAFDNLFCIKTSLNLTDAQRVNVNIKQELPNVVKLILNDKENQSHIQTSGIAQQVESHCTELVNQFIAYTSQLSNVEKIYISYQDEHLKSGIGVVATLQFISYFIKKINKDFELTFRLEAYDYEPFSISYPTFDRQLIEGDRNSILERLIEEFLDLLDNEDKLKGSYNIDVGERKSLPHWRVLSFQCGQKILRFYPDGGIINEWFFDRENSRRLTRKFFEYDNLSVKDNICIKRRNDILYYVELVDVEK